MVRAVDKADAMLTLSFTIYLTYVLTYIEGDHVTWFGL